MPERPEPQVPERLAQVLEPLARLGRRQELQERALPQGRRKPGSERRPGLEPGPEPRRHPAKARGLRQAAEPQRAFRSRRFPRSAPRWNASGAWT